MRTRHRVLDQTLEEMPGTPLRQWFRRSQTEAPIEEHAAHSGLLPDVVCPVAREGNFNNISRSKLASAFHTARIVSRCVLLVCVRHPCAMPMPPPHPRRVGSATARSVLPLLGLGFRVHGLEFRVEGLVPAQRPLPTLCTGGDSTSGVLSVGARTRLRT